MKKKKTISKRKLLRPPVKSDDVPATRGMLFEVRGEMMSRFNGLEHKSDGNFRDMTGRFTRLEGRFDGLERRFVGLEGRFEKLEARFDVMEVRFEKLEGRINKLEVRIDGMERRFESRFDAIDLRFDGMFELMKSLSENVQAQMHKISLMVEEQRAQNKYVLDGYTSLYDRQDRVEAELKLLTKK